MSSRIRFVLAAALMLGWSVAPAQEAEILRFNNDFEDNVSVGLWNCPLPMDYDGDGVRDLVVSCPDTPYRGLYFFRNIGTNANPFFDRAVKISSRGENYIRVSEVEGEARVLSPGVEYSDFRHKLFSEPDTIPYKGDPIELERKRSHTWEYVDFDGDGDQDIIVGIDTWKDYGWDNAYDQEGNWKNGPLKGYVHLIKNNDGVFENAGPLPITTYGAPTPCVADFDGDGDLDVICGEFVDGLTWYENIQMMDNPSFAEGRRLRNRHGEITVHVEMIVPVACDFDGDGHVDLIVGDEDGTVSWLRNTGKVRKHMPVFEDLKYFRQKSDLLKFGALATPCAYDWDGDGDQDIISGNSAGDICLIRNLSEGKEPLWAAPEFFKVGRKPFRVMAGENGSIQGPAERKWGYTVLSVSDMDGDGRPDIVFNSILGKVQWLRNKGSRSGLKMSGPRPVMVAWEGETPKPEWNWWTPEKGTLVTQWRTSPVMIDWNKDGHDDLVTLDQEGYLCLYERIPGEVFFKPGKRIFNCENCSSYNNINGVVDPEPGLLRLNAGKAGSSGRRKFCFTDWDGDGRLDLVVDSRNASWFKNISDDGVNTTFRYMGDISSTRLAGHSTCPTPFDWDGDGVTDILLGGEDGHFYLVRNDRKIGLEARVEKTLSGLSLEEKVGQMVQLTISVLEDDTHEALDPAKMDEIFGVYKVGSILNVMNGRAHSREQTAVMIRQIQEKSMEKIGIPCIYGLDMVHGANYLTDGTIFPHEINLAATFDPSFARKMGEVTAYETRAAMVPWVFTPTVDLGRDPRWPRIWENWGEDAYLSTVMSVEETLGLQGEDPNYLDQEHTSATLKCFIAYSVPYTGKDRTPAYVPDHDLREKYFAPFLGGFKAGAHSIMVNSSSVNGMPVHANKTLLTGWAKEQTGWDGMIVTDWSDLNNLYERDHVAADKREAIKIGINAGVDMIMEPYDKECCSILADLVRSGEIPMSRIDDAVRRILRMKYRAGLFDNPVWDTDAFSRFGCKEFADDSYRAALESEILLKNEGVLPIERGKKILVAGPNANSLRTLNGGWTYTWQGEGDSYVPQYNTILEAMINKFGAGNVIYEPGVTYDLSVNDWPKENVPEIDKAVTASREADVIVVCVGENSYCETTGNINDLNLSSNQKDLVMALAATGKPVVLVLNEGRPRIIGDIEPQVDAVVDVMLPGNYGGDALAALLSGEENFSAKLPFTYSKHINALHTYDYKVSEHREMMDGAYNYDAVMDVQWPFGHGLSYTEYSYSDFKCQGSRTFGAGDVLEFSVKVKNTGGRDGREAVLLFSSDLVASLIPDVKRLRAFSKVDLKKGESKVVRFEVPASSLAFVGADGKWRLEEGDFRFACGGQSITRHCDETKIWQTPNIN